jgi:hypothetical protein
MWRGIFFLHRPCLDTQILSQISLCKKKIPRHIEMYGVLNVDEIKN